jgi:hypothetical protein
VRLDLHDHQAHGMIRWCLAQRAAAE